MTFREKLKNIIKKNNSLLCVGLDPDLEKFPTHLPQVSDSIFTFNQEIIEATHDVVCAYKPNSAYYEAYGVEGLIQLKKTLEYLHDFYPEIPIILDAKRADIGNTSAKYAIAAFEELGVDAITVNPYLGFDALEPFINYRDKGVIILCRTSNKGATDFQDIHINNQPFYIHVAEKIITWNKQHGNCLMVIGATWPEELKAIRKLTQDMFFLIPGVGAQGGDIEKVMHNGLTENKSGLIISTSRVVLFASAEKDYAKKAREKAEELKEEINQYR